MHPAERPGDGEEPDRTGSARGMRPEEEIHRFLKEKLGFQGPVDHWWPASGPLWPHAPARPKLFLDTYGSVPLT